MNKKLVLTGMFSAMLILTLVFFGCGDLGNPDGPGPGPGPSTNVAATPVATVNPPTSVYAQNADAADLTLTATVSAGDLTYQWFSNTSLSASGGTAIPDATTTTYTPSTETVGDSYYYVVVTNTDETKEVTTAVGTSNIVWIRVTDQATTAATIMVNTGTKYQWVRGFGGMMNGWGNSPPMSQKDIDTSFSADGLGLNIFRVMIYPYMDDLFNGVEAAPASEPDIHQQYYNRIRRAKSHGATILASPWTPPAEWKNTGSRIGGSHLLEEHWGDYAQHLKGYIDRMARNNAAIDFITIQNEPDIGVTYDGCDWTGEEMRDFIKRYARVIAPKDGPVKISPGESYQFRDAFLDPIYNDPEAIDAVDIIAGHLYGGGLRRHTKAINAGKEVWQTEHLFNTASNYNIDAQWQSVWIMVQEVHDCMTFDFTAYVWWYVKRFYGLVGDGEYGTLDGTPLYRGYALSHYAKYAADKMRVNTVPLGAANNTNVQVTAYESDTEITLVMFNRGATNVDSLNIDLPVAVTDASMVITKGASNTDVTNGQKMEPGTITLSNGNRTGVFDLPASSIISVRFTK